MVNKIILVQKVILSFSQVHALVHYTTTCPQKEKSDHFTCHFCQGNIILDG